MNNVESNLSRRTIYYITIFVCVSVILLIFFRLSNFNPIISFISPLIIALISVYIALKSDEKMEKIAVSNFLGISRDLVGSRFTFFKEINRIAEIGDIRKSPLKEKAQQILEMATWESYLCIQQAYVLNKWATNKARNKIANALFILMNNVFDFRKLGIVKNVHIEHLLMTCIELCDFEVDEAYITNIRCLLQKHLGTMKPKDISFKGYLVRKRKQIKTGPSGKLTPDEYLGMPFEGIE